MAEKGGAASLTTAIRVGEGDRGYDMRKKNPAFLEHLKEVITKVGTQAKVAKEISASGSRIPEWNAGKRLPSADTLIRLGRVALEHSASDPFYFWALAGIDPQTLKSMASKVVEWEEEVAGPTIPIRRYRQTLEGREESGPPVSLPSEFVPRPRQTVCLDVDGAIGSDVLEAPRGLFIVEISTTDVDRPKTFWNRVMVVHYAPPEGTSLGTDPHGIYIGRLGLEGPSLSSGRQHFGFGAVLSMLTMQNLWPSSGGRIVEYAHTLYLGNHFEPAATATARPGGEAADRAEEEAVKRALSDFRLAKGIHIVGKVIGRLTGHLETSRQGEK